MKKILAVIAASVYLMSPTANAQTITGAGATFPFPFTASGAKHTKKKPTLNSTIKALVVQVVSNKSKRPQWTLAQQMHP
jgi:ABC-type phosphate transport system substrate-binding protein